MYLKGTVLNFQVPSGIWLWLDRNKIQPRLLRFTTLCRQLGNCNNSIKYQYQFLMIVFIFHRLMDKFIFLISVNLSVISDVWCKIVPFMCNSSNQTFFFTPPEPAIKKIQENTTQVWAVVEPYLRLGLSDLSCSNFQQSLVHKTGLMLYLADFHSWNWRIPGFDENKTQHRALFFTKSNQGRFYFHMALLLKSSLRSRSCQSRDTSCRHSSGSQIGA